MVPRTHKDVLKHQEQCSIIPSVRTSNNSCHWEYATAKGHDSFKR